MGRYWHRQLGLWFGLVLMLVSVSGAILLYKNPLLQWQYPQLQLPYQSDLAVWGKVLDQLPQQEYGFARIPTPERPWLELSRHDGTLEYYSASGQLLLSRTLYQDWIGWSYQLHMYLFVKDWDHQLLGLAGLLAFALFILGLKISWPRHWNWRLWRPPAARQDGRRARHWHWLLGLFTLPLVGWTVLTGTVMVYNKEVTSGLAWLLNERLPAKAPQLHVDFPLQNSAWSLWLPAAQQAVPEGKIRLASFRKSANQPLSFRLQLPEEWHPNGRTQLVMDPQTATVLQLTKATELGPATQTMQLVYPLHIAAVGGFWYKLLLVAAALLVVLLWWLGLLWRLGRNKKSGN
ncbi:PepSY-associated TM helix domain-containing protein [Rheinheimera marina]|uniref:PepSY-associated TM helix domain-containing protein n=1 Tax=Rheinheimera marina TaxID=1774958 RepID=A0ABV9JJ10_9GAMM